jgi:thermitase
MGSKRFYNLIFAIFLFFAFLTSVNNAYSQDEFVPDQLIIRLEEGANFPDIVDELAEDGIYIVDSIQELNVYVLQVPVEELQDIQNSLSQNPDFQYVSKNHIVTANAVPNDTSYGLQTHFDLIDAEQAWDTETGNPDVIIAVLDTGVEAAHEDLAGKVLTGCSTLGAFNETSCGTNTNDIDSHGSGVSGTAAAQTNNTTGVAGICWGCQILPVKVLNDNGTGTDVDVTQGILFAKDYALANPAKKVIINMSLGRDCENSPLDPSMQAAIDLAWNAGVLVVAAAGNDGTSNLHCPASANNTIAVSATNNFDQLSDFSTFGTFVDLAAPGGNLAPFHFIYNVEGNTNNGYTEWVGTSFSSPIVVGVAGLVWSANMSLTNAQVDQILRTTADNIGSSFFYGDGRVNANAAVLAAGGPPPPTPSPTPIPTPTPTPPPPSNPVLTELDPGNAGGTSTLSITGAPAGSNIIFQYSLSTGTHLISGGICSGQSLSINNPQIIGSTTANGAGAASINVLIPQEADGVTLHLQAQAEGGSQCGISNRVTQTIDSNPPPTPSPTPIPTPTPTPPPPSNPVLTELDPGNAGGTSTLSITGAPAGSNVIFQYSLSTGTHLISGGICSGQSLSINNPQIISSTTANGLGTATINVPIPQAADGVTLHLQAQAEGGSQCGISNRVTQTIGSNPPTVNLVLTPLNPGEAGGTSTLQVTGAPSGETIKFKYSFTTGSSAISGGTCNGQNLDINSQNNIGMTSANGSGVATLNVPIPNNAAGITLHMQAYTDTGGNCGISNRVTQVLQ